jgi:non-ribosomal peptide synthetase component F
LDRVRGIASWLAGWTPPRSRIAVVVRAPEWRTLLTLSVAAADRTLVPLDPDWSPDRCRVAVGDARPAVVLGDAASAGSAAWSVVSTVRELGELLLAPELVDPATDASELHVVFTSGSTGRPKGVRILPAAALAHVESAVNWLGLTETDVVFQFTRLVFDASLEEIWSSFAVGATIAVPSSPMPTFTGLARDLCRHQVSVLDLPTAYWRAWAAALRGRAIELPALRLVCFGGEPAYWRDAHTWRTGPLGHVRLMNSYGPTEAGITALAYEVPTEVPDVMDGLPLGRPLGSREAHLEWHDHDRYELLISGAALSAGYLHPPARAESPFMTVAGQRRYRTGDLVRKTADGSLVYAGRRDREVKIRGQRVRLDDVESAVLAVAGVREARVLVFESGSDRFLVAAAASDMAPDQAAKAIRAELAAWDTAASPRHVVLLDALPRNSSGKVDAPALERWLLIGHPTWRAAH